MYVIYSRIYIYLSVCALPLRNAPAILSLTPPPSISRVQLVYDGASGRLDSSPLRVGGC